MNRIYIISLNMCFISSIVNYKSFLFLGEGIVIIFDIITVALILCSNKQYYAVGTILYNENKIISYLISFKYLNYIHFFK